MDLEKINSLKERRKNLDPNIKKEKKQYKISDDMSVGYKVLSEFIGGIGVGFGIGYGLDTYFQTKPVFIIIMVIVGFISAIVNVARTTK